ncbi:hypothetical protein ABW19_dt0201513 [Dactylella cylindrospora]|nr:hypothetical protein ABW19_dt0201513 [Dactylella cylindrospora]
MSERVKIFVSRKKFNSRLRSEHHSFGSDHPSNLTRLLLPTLDAFCPSSFDYMYPALHFFILVVGHDDDETNSWRCSDHKSIPINPLSVGFFRTMVWISNQHHVEEDTVRCLSVFSAPSFQLRVIPAKMPRSDG